VLPVLVTTTVAVLVSVAPDPLSVPAAAPPSFSLTPNQGSGPIWNVVAGFGVATMVAVHSSARIAPKASAAGLASELKAVDLWDRRPIEKDASFFVMGASFNRERAAIVTMGALGRPSNGGGT
jgi:hypothetical protein